MAEKKKELTPEQAAVLRRRGLLPEKFVVILDYPETLLVRDTVTKEAQVIYKKDPWGSIKQ